MSKNKQTRKAQLKQQKKKANHERRKPLARKEYLRGIKEARAAIREERKQAEVINRIPLNILEEYVVDVFRGKLELRSALSTDEILFQLRDWLPPTLVPERHFLLDVLEAIREAYCYRLTEREAIAIAITYLLKLYPSETMSLESALNSLLKVAGLGELENLDNYQQGKGELVK